jgi:hypothetical protein
VERRAVTSSAASSGKNNDRPATARSYRRPFLCHVCAKRGDPNLARLTTGLSSSGLSSSLLFSFIGWPGNSCQGFVRSRGQAKLSGGAMSVPKARVVRSLVVAAFAATCLTSGVTSAFAQRGGFHGGFRGCFNCGFRGSFFAFGFAPGWGWGWPGWGWGWGWPGWGPGWAPPGWGPGWGSTPGWVTPPATYASPAPQAASPSGQSCYAGAYVCPTEHPVPSGSGCYCLSNNRTRVFGRAS